MPIISAFPTGESTVDYTGPKSGLPSLEEGKVAYVTDEKRLYTGNADGKNTQVPNAEDLSSHTSNKNNPHGVTAEQVGADAKGSAAQALTDAKSYADTKTSSLASKTEVSDAVSSHNSAEDAHADKFAKYLPLAGGEMTGDVYFKPLVNDGAGTISMIPTGGINGVNRGIVFEAKSHRDDVGYLRFGYGNFLANPEKGAEFDLRAGYTYLGSEKINIVGETTIENVVTPTTDTMPTPKSYVDSAINNIDSAIGNITPSACKVTLSASGWDSSAKTQSVTVSGVLEDESKQLIMPMPAGTSMSAYNDAGIQMTAQGANTVTFTADTVPTANIDVWVVFQNVNDVTPSPALDEVSWEYISQQSLAGNAKNIWAVGDCKKIKLSGTAGALSLDTELYVYILDFDHDSSAAGGTKDGITFGTFKTALTDGVDVALYNSSGFGMNTSSTNSGGWKNSNMRYTILGSTNTQNGDATAATATSPVANSLMSCLPADLRAVMRPMCVYTDNTGGGSDTASYVTTTIDFLPLLAEFELHGARTYANSAEKNNQTQYAYFKNGNSKVKYQHAAQSSATFWWSRSPYSSNSSSFCLVTSSGSAYSNGAYYSRGVAPAFKV